jgi:hypothetical protein
VLALDALSRAEAPPLLEEKSFEEVGGANQAAVVNWASQVGNAGFEVILEAGDGRGIFTAVALSERLSQNAGIFRGRRLIGGLRRLSEIGPSLFRKLVHEIAHSMGETALT